MKGYAAGIKQLMIVIYKTITPWAHSVALSNFLAGTLTTSLVRVIKDSSKIVSVQSLSDYWISAFAMYPSFIRVV